VPSQDSERSWICVTSPLVIEVPVPSFNKKWRRYTYSWSLTVLAWHRYFNKKWRCYTYSWLLTALA
jgi:hypothetical protein